MSRKTLSHLLVMMAATIWIPLCNATQPDRIKLRLLTENFPPFNYQSDSGELIGFSVEVVSLFEAQVTNEFQIEVLPWSRAYNYTLTQPNTALFSMYRIPARETLFQ